MSSVLYRMGRVAAQRRKVVILLWVLALCAAGGAAAAFQQGTDDTFTIPGSEGQDALDHLSRVFPQISGGSAVVIVTAPEGRPVDTPADRAAVAGAVTQIKKLPQVIFVQNPFDKSVSGAVSKDGRAAVISVQLTVDRAHVSTDTKAELTRIGADLEQRIGPGSVQVGGDAFFNPIPTITVTEGLGLLAALLVLLLFFRSLIAALVPVATALVGAGITVAALYAVTPLTPISSTAPLLAVMIGLAVGIDYALFSLSRHRDQLSEGMEIEESIARANATAGSAVVFAGLTVIIALLGLSVARIPFLTTMAVASAVSVTMAVSVAVTLIPALLGLLGERLRPRGSKAGDGDAAQQGGISRRWVRLATRAPLITVLLITVGLGALAVPAKDLRLSLPDSSTELVGTQARDSYDLLEKEFGPGVNGSLIVTVDVLQSTDPIALTDKIAQELRGVRGVASVPLATPNPMGDTAIVQVIPASGPSSPQTADLVHRLRAMEPHFRAEYGVDTAVTGFTAITIDVSQKLAASLLPFALLVVGLSILLLAMVFRSIWVPIKATAGYLLSVGAAFGVTSLVWMHGVGAGFLNVDDTGSVISFLPIIMMGCLFGLAMDYEVFLVSRMREDYVHNGNAHRAIGNGFAASSKVVVAAAVIMLSVFIAFVPEGTVTIKPIAFALAIGVFVDAFLIRMTLVPAVLALLGERAWMLPGRLERKLPVFDAEGDGLLHELRLADWPQPESTEVVSARGLRVQDDRGTAVITDLELHLAAGAMLGIHGPGPAGKTALLYALGGHISRIGGDLKVLGTVLPQHSAGLRRKVAVIQGRTSRDPAAEVAAAIDDGVRLLLFDDLDSVVAPGQRQALRTLFTSLTPSGDPVSVVFTCHDPSLLKGLMPQGKELSIVELLPKLAGVV